MIYEIILITLIAILCFFSYKLGRIDEREIHIKNYNELYYDYKKVCKYIIENL